MDRISLEQLSKEELIELVLRLQRPSKTSRTSSKPPSTDKKAKRENARPGGAKAGHEPHNRKLCGDPDAFVDHMPKTYVTCGAPVFSGAVGTLVGSYDVIDIPPIKPHVVRHRRYSCRCQRCGAETKAPAPAVATSTPFGPRIHALAVCFKSFQALSCERLCGLFRDVFGLAISEGAVMNMFARARSAFSAEAEKARTALRSARFVASDETGVRIEGTNAYHWVLNCRDAVVHQPDYSRAAGVVEDVMNGHVSDVWTSDRHSARQSHGMRQQTCLAHLARDAAYAMENGSDDLPFRFKLWFDRVFALARTIADLAPATLARKRRELEKQLAHMLDATTLRELARKLQAKIRRAQDQLLTFCDYPGEAEPANNGSGRKLRPCVTQRKVTNGYRAMWAAQAEADMRTTIYTARLKGSNPFNVILNTRV
jgi:transposase